ncbi:MAG: glycosyltransferase family 2 protein [Clostridiales bacterium]|nr:glycosyltransferase family 2 protein [Clostridiales bacterium]
MSQSKSHPFVSASIVTYNNVNDMKTLLQNLYQLPSLLPKDIHIIDNGSTDGTLEMIHNFFPEVSLHPQNENIGFGKGHNIVLPILSSDFHFIINPDIAFQPAMVEGLLTYISQNPKVVLLSPKVLFPNGEEQFLPKELPSVHYLAGGFFERFGRPFTTWRSTYTWNNKVIIDPTPISFATGCFMVVSTKAYQQVKGFDPRYFMYMEDADLSRKMAALGDVIYHPDYTVTHFWQRDSSKHVANTKYHLKSVWQYFKKWGWKW